MPEQVERNAAEQACSRDRVELHVDSGDRPPRAEREEDDPGDEQQMDVAVCVGCGENWVVVAAQMLLRVLCGPVEVGPPEADDDEERERDRGHEAEVELVPGC